MLSSVKRFLGLNDTDQDELLKEIIQESSERILDYINQGRATPLSVLPERTNYILRDVILKRYNRISSEGASSDREEGKAVTWESSYLAEYEGVLSQYRDPKGGRGVAMFI